MHWLTRFSAVRVAPTDMTEAGTRFQPVLDEAATRELIGTVSLLAGALWQVSTPAEALARLYAEEPRLAHAAVDFLPRLTSAARALAADLAVAPGEPPSGARS
ncbi:hypothetical protein ACU639_29335 [Streptomyces cynarae]|uniref:hypothetical protein n=1 Tax=Streptomyces cynarae TaxID=2981134 RepID=UPI00406D08A6